MEGDASQVSREEKEALLNKRMEEIRMRNAALQKRHEEVLADKQNAEFLSNKFQESRQGTPTTHLPTNVGKSRPPPQPKVMGRARFNERMEPTKPVAPEHDKRRAQRLTEEDGPPPDPGYRFLADRQREGNTQQRSDERSQGSRRHAGNYGGQDFENVKSSMQKRKTQEKGDPWHGPQNKMEMAMRMTGRERREYEQWKCERSRIEEDRMNRHKTSSGEWRREWDRDKNSTDEEPETSQWESRRTATTSRDGCRGDRSTSRGASLRRGGNPSPRHAGEITHQDGGPTTLPHGDFMPRTSDFPCLPDDDDKITPSPGRRIEINRNTINISFSTDPNDNCSPTERRGWRNNDKLSSRNSTGSSHSEEESVPRSRGAWRAHKQGARATRMSREQPTPTRDWRDARPIPHEERRGGGAVDDAHYGSAAGLAKQVVYRDLREVLQQTKHASPEVPPNKDAKGPSVNDINVVATPESVEEREWEDEGSWEEVASGVGSSQGFSSENELEVTTPGVPQNLNALERQLGETVGEHNFEKSDSLFTRMAEIEFSTVMPYSSLADISLVPPEPDNCDAPLPYLDCRQLEIVLPELVPSEPVDDINEVESLPAVLIDHDSSNAINLGDSDNMISGSDECQELKLTGPGQMQHSGPLEIEQYTHEDHPTTHSLETDSGNMYHILKKNELLSVIGLEAIDLEAITLASPQEDNLLSSPAMPMLLPSSFSDESSSSILQENLPLDLVPPLVDDLPSPAMPMLPQLLSSEESPSSVLQENMGVQQEVCSGGPEEIGHTDHHDGGSELKDTVTVLNNELRLVDSVTNLDSNLSTDVQEYLVSDMGGELDMADGDLEEIYYSDLPDEDSGEQSESNSIIDGGTNSDAPPVNIAEQRKALEQNIETCSQVEKSVNTPESLETFEVADSQDSEQSCELPRNDDLSGEESCGTGADDGKDAADDPVLQDDCKGLQPSTLIELSISNLPEATNELSECESNKLSNSLTENIVVSNSAD